uniref:Capsid protein n=2 Tax=Pyrus pyrifolia cryptic virus TaxID=1968822 RepID=A0A224AUQ0_9VIRU|nr:capsid protein [Pyrus pyrifolia cryptic virus]
MSNTGEETAPNGPINGAKTQEAGPAGKVRSTTRKLIDRLLSKRIIGESVSRKPKHPRYVPLRKNEIFEALTELYALNFQAKWNILKPLLREYSIPQGLAGWMYLARVYISHWFIDLYVSNREACEKHTAIRISEFYMKQLGCSSNYYDTFLVLLSASTRPTRILGLQEDTLYVPLITNRYSWASPTRNYFDITNFSYNLDLLGALIDTMSNSQFGWRMFPTVNDALGRPCWLLDWHDDQCYAWFPEEGNYTDEDTNLSFILGVSCTPHLASRDDDMPQFFPGNTVPDDEEHFLYERSTSKRFHGNIDKRVIEHFDLDIPILLPPLPPPFVGEGSGQPSGAAMLIEGAEPEQESGRESPAQTQTRPTFTSIIPMPPPGPRIHNHQVFGYVIMDYKYYDLVVYRVDINSRSAAHKVLVYKD